VHLFLLRHGEVTSHAGDVPITADAEQKAFEVGQGFGRRHAGAVLILSGETRRAITTAANLAKGITDVGGRVLGPQIAFALRNPDLYVAGTRVNMVSSADALAEQVEGLAADDVVDLDFFPEFFESPDRIGWWLTHDSPPGETAAALAGRVTSFARSLADRIPGDPEIVVAVTHSPLLRAVAIDLLGRDIGEPGWISGLVLDVSKEGSISAGLWGPEAG
jgi:broad specificity phosphatase PhoE